jgi:hypothetical protein
MSFEWARARTMQNGARRRALARASERESWTEVSLALPARVIVWCELLRPQPPASDVLAVNEDNLPGVTAAELQ